MNNENNNISKAISNQDDAGYIKINTDTNFTQIDGNTFIEFNEVINKTCEFLTGK